ncbi:low molecular weight protein-tyrosine-phosphatase [Litorivivens sp.]|uniref:low molecular weight protein-tyrosine-phosphatase n=1 Tax=Litorivivens sp. TaxID=2020868 RepID=UPI003566EDA9
MVRVLFVCLGNICRSPTAHAVFQQMVDEQGLGSTILVDSAGTGDWHIGRPPDPRASAAAQQRGVDMSALRARQFQADDFHNFDYILAMDEDNLRDILAQEPGSHSAQVGLFLDYATHFEEREVPDPYYGGDEGFEHVLNLIEDAARGLLERLGGSRA